MIDVTLYKDIYIMKRKTHGLKGYYVLDSQNNREHVYK